MSFYPSEKSKGLDSLNDAIITSPKNHEVLMHNGTEWENSDVLKEYELVESDNLLENHAVSTASAGITYTVLDDGSVDVDGTLTATVSRLYLTSYNEYGRLPIPDGTYKMVGTPSTITGTATAYLNFWNCNGDGQNHIDNGSGLEITYAGSYTSDLCVVVLGEVGDTISHALFKPMITKNLNATYADFVPYKKSIKDQLKEYEVVPGKNLLPITATTTTTNGVTFTVNSDGTVKVNGTASAVTFFVLCTKLYESGVYKLVGCPTGGHSGNSYALQLRDMDNQSIIMDNGDGAQHSLTTANYRIGIRIAQNYTVSNLVFKPMLTTDLDVTVADFEPYYLPLKDGMLPRSEQAILGAKNWIPYPYTETTKSQNGITFTDNGDGTITVNTVSGGTTGDAVFSIYNSGLSFLKNGVAYKLSDGGVGFRNSSNQSAFGIYVQRRTASASSGDYATTYDGVTVTFTPDNTAYPYISIGIYVRSGTILNNVKVRPMIRLASDPDETYASHAKTNGELTESKADVSVIGTAENGPTASKAYSVGEHFIRGGQFCLVIANISSGATLTKDTNYRERPAEREMNAYNTDIPYYSSGNCDDLPIGFTYVGAGVSNTAEAWSMILTYALNMSRQDLFQISLGISSGNIYYRKRNNNGTFTSWQKQITCASQSLTSSNNLNDITETGYYFVRDSSPVNSPESIQWYSLFVNRVNYNNIQQQIFKSNVIYQRTYGGATPTWGSWYKFTGTVVS